MKKHAEACFFLGKDRCFNKMGIIVKYLIHPCLAGTVFPGNAKSITIRRQSWNRPLIDFQNFGTITGSPFFSADSWAQIPAAVMLPPSCSSIQGVLVTGAAVYGNQIYKQLRIDD